MLGKPRYSRDERTRLELVRKKRIAFICNYLIGLVRRLFTACCRSSFFSLFPIIKCLMIEMREYLINNLISERMNTNKDMSPWVFINILSTGIHPRIAESGAVGFRMGVKRGARMITTHEAAERLYPVVVDERRERNVLFGAWRATARQLFFAGGICIGFAGAIGRSRQIREWKIANPDG